MPTTAPASAGAAPTIVAPVASIASGFIAEAWPRHHASMNAWGDRVNARVVVRYDRASFQAVRRPSRNHGGGERSPIARSAACKGPSSGGGGRRDRDGAANVISLEMASVIQGLARLRVARQSGRPG